MTVAAMVDNGAGEPMAKSLGDLGVDEMRRDLGEVGSGWDDNNRESNLFLSFVFFNSSFSNASIHSSSQKCLC